MDIVEWKMSMPVVRLFVGSALIIYTGLACRGYTTDRNAFYVLFQKIEGLHFSVCLNFSLGFTFKV